MPDPGSFHILHHQAAPDHRGRIKTVCGEEVIKDGGNYCNVSIADPLGWDNDWCRDCLTVIPWTDEVKAELKARGMVD